MNVLKLIKENLFPPAFTCDVCGLEIFEGHICPDCLKETSFNDNITCPICGRRTKIHEICPECKARPPLFECAVSALVYEGTAIRLIHKFKNGEAYLKDYFAELLVPKIADFKDVDYIAYVPMTKKAVRKRGYNQAQLLAQSISARTGIPVTDIVEKVKSTHEQKSLTFAERAKNLEGSFKVKGGRNALLDKNILLVDDVLTTGATAEAMCMAFFKAGVIKVYLATVASVEDKDDREKFKVKDKS